MRLTSGSARAGGCKPPRLLTYSLCLRLLRDPTEAEEVAQEAFLRVWRQTARYDAGRGTLATWVLTITPSPRH